jgi:HK97 family phage portal protein
VAFVVSAGQLTAATSPLLPVLPPSSVQLTDGLYADFATIWRTQAQVRTVVNFLARNIAQLGLHFYRRESDVDRVRLSDHPVAALFARPNPSITTYRLIQTLVSDFAVYDRAYWVKVREGNDLLGLVPVPPSRVRPVGSSWLSPDEFEIRPMRSTWSDRSQVRRFPADQVVHFRGYDPENPWSGNSPMNALRSMLIEEYEATRQRQNMWRNGARHSAWITRPVDAPGWSPEARERFTSQFRSAYTGAGGDIGGVPLLEDGMSLTAQGMDAKQMQYIEGRRLTREEVCSAYFIPPPMIGILDHATFSNIREQHNMLYQDCLGPWLAMIAQEIALQVLPDMPDASNIYAEFNIGAKMQGSFEEQAVAASTAAGRPWMTANEVRARFNLPQHDDGDDLVVPLNVLVGGQASPRDSAPKSAEATRLDRVPVAELVTHQ